MRGGKNRDMLDMLTTQDYTGTVFMITRKVAIELKLDPDNLPGNYKLMQPVFPPIVLDPEGEQ